MHGEKRVRAFLWFVDLDIWNAFVCSSSAIVAASWVDFTTEGSFSLKTMFLRSMTLYLRSLHVDVFGFIERVFAVPYPSTCVRNAYFEYIFVEVVWCLSS